MGDNGFENFASGPGLDTIVPLLVNQQLMEGITLIQLNLQR